MYTEIRVTKKSPFLDVFQIDFALMGLPRPELCFPENIPAQEYFAARKMLTINFRETASHAQYSPRCVSARTVE